MYWKINMNFKNRSVSNDEFKLNISRAEKFYGVGSNVVYDATCDLSLWSVAGRPIALTRGGIARSDGMYDAYLIMQDTWTFGEACPVPQYLENS